MRATRRPSQEGPRAGRPVSRTEDDFQHLMECVETDCWYCSDRSEPQLEREPEVQAWLDALHAASQLAA